MGMSQEGGKMEGWLYLIRSNRFGLQYSRKRYFVLEGNALNCFKSIPTSNNEDPRRSALIDSCIRVTDNGRERIHRNVFCSFILYNASNQSDQLKLGARSSEEAANWIHSLTSAALKECPSSEENNVACSNQKSVTYRFSHSRGRSRMYSIDWTVFPSIHMHPVTSDVIAPSPWTIFGCNNGLRLFKEAKDGDFFGKYWDDHPAIMAVGVVDASSETIFQTIMSLGPSRSEWDFCFSHGKVVEQLDSHTDIIHKQLKGDWLPWGMKRRDLLLQRYWRRDEDGTHVILYHSVYHKNCRPLRGYIRACIKSGGYVISPANQGKQSVVKHMLAVDWKCWKSYLFASSAKHITIQMLGRVAALREFFSAKLGSFPGSGFSSGELTRYIGIPQTVKEEIKEEVKSNGENNNSDDPTKDSQTPVKAPIGSGSFLQLNDAADEFFDVMEQSEYVDSEDILSSDSFMHSQDQRHPKLSKAATFVKRWHDLAVQRRGYSELQEEPAEDTAPCIYGATLPNDPSCSLPCTWAAADPSSFLVRGETYLQDHHKIKANSTLMQLVAADWLKSDKREDDLGGRPSSIVQKYAAQGGSEFFFIINIQVPGSTTHSLAFYYMMDMPLENLPLLESFVRGDDAYRNSRFKLIPYICEGSWIVKQSVGRKACLIGQALEINYFRGRNYLELGINIGSSSVARGVTNLILGCLNNLVIEMAFLIQANDQEELPEVLLGTCRVNHLDASRAVTVSESVTTTTVYDEMKPVLICT